MKKRLITLSILFIIVGFWTYGQAEDKPGADEKPALSFVDVLQHNALTLDYSDSTGKIDEKSILGILWSGGGLLKEENAKDEDSEDETESSKTFTHPTYYTSFLDFYFIDENGLYQYNNISNKLTLVSKGNFLSDLKLGSTVKYGIIVSLSNSSKRLMNAIDIKLSEREVADDIVKDVKSYHKENKSILKEASYIEAGTAITNMMFMAAANNLYHYPVSLQSMPKTFPKSIGIKKKGSKPFIVIPLSTNNSKDDRGLAEYVNNLIRNGQNAEAKDFKNKSPVSYEDIRQLLWTSDGVISSDDKKIHPSGFPFSNITVYYVNQKQVQKYDSLSNSLKTIKFRDMRTRLGKSFRKYKAKDYIILSISSNKSNVKKKSALFRGQPKSFTKLNNKVLKSSSSTKGASFFQIGVAMQNIRLLATDLGLAYQVNHVRENDRSEIASGLSLEKGDIPIMIIPLAPK